MIMIIMHLRGGVRRIPLHCKGLQERRQSFIAKVNIRDSTVQAEGWGRLRVSSVKGARERMLCSL